MDQDREYGVQLVSTGGVCAVGASGGGFDDVGERLGFVSRRARPSAWRAGAWLPLELRASCRVHGGSAFELDAGSGSGQTGAALASAGMVRLSCAWPHL